MKTCEYFSDVLTPKESDMDTFLTNHKLLETNNNDVYQSNVNIINLEKNHEIGYDDLEPLNLTVFQKEATTESVIPIPSGASPTEKITASNTSLQNDHHTHDNLETDGKLVNESSL